VGVIVIAIAAVGVVSACAWCFAGDATAGISHRVTCIGIYPLRLL
jgi:hypothetical protein